MDLRQKVVSVESWGLCASATTTPASAITHTDAATNAQDFIETLLRLRPPAPPG